MKVTVTQADIEEARRCIDSALPYERRCPVACALGRMGFEATVCTHHVQFLPFCLDVILPEDAIQWIREYDKNKFHGASPKPFSFKLAMDI